MSELQTQKSGHNHSHSHSHACGCGCDHGAKEQAPFMHGKMPIIIAALIVIAIAASFFFKI